MSAFWPAGLPAPRLGASFTTAMKRQTSEFDVAQIERVTDKNLKQRMSASWLLSEEQFQVFIAWWVHICGDGSAWFSMEWDNRPGMAQFQSKYSSQQDGNLRAVSAELLIDYA